MRLIGGNISDTPVKEIGDGSAFSVAAASGTPPLLGLGSFSSLSSPISASGWERPHNNGVGFAPLIGTFGQNYVLINSGNTIVWACVRESDDEVYLATIPVSSGTLGTPTAAQDKSGDFTTSTTGHICVMKDPASENKVIVMLFSDVSTRRIEMGCYTVSGATFTKVGSIQTHVLATDSLAAFDNMSCQLHSDGNTGVVTCINNTSTNQVQCIPFNHTSNQTFGTAVASGITQQSSATVYFTSTLIGSGGEVITFNGKNRILEWTLTTGSTPSVAFHEDHSTVELGTMWNIYTGIPAREAGNQTLLIQLDEPEDVGQCCMLQRYGGMVMRFSGVTKGKHRYKAASRGASTDAYPWGFRDIENVGGAVSGLAGDMSRFIKIDEIGGWCRGVVMTMGPYVPSGTYAGAYGPTSMTAANVHVRSGSIYFSDDLVTTANFYAGVPYSGQMHTLYSGGNIIVLGQHYTSTTSPDSYMTCPVTIT